jgi:hypothetical protein
MTQIIFGQVITPNMVVFLFKKYMWMWFSNNKKAKQAMLNTKTSSGSSACGFSGVYHPREQHGVGTQAPVDTEGRTCKLT